MTKTRNCPETQGESKVVWPPNDNWAAAGLKLKTELAIKLKDKSMAKSAISFIKFFMF